jgi:hypothetical protein
MRNAKGLAASAACHELGRANAPDQRTREGQSVMKQNMGTVDRGLRAFVATPAAIVVAFLLVTSLTGYCPNYTIIGITTEHGVHRVPRWHLHAHHA